MSDSHREKAQYFNKIVAPYLGPDHRRSAWQLINTAVPFFALWYAAYRSLEVSYGLTLLLTIPIAGLLVRLFIIQHDLGHGNFLKNQRVADKIGFFLGIITLTPYRYWRKTHAMHHAHSGDLDFRDFGEVQTLTVQEYHQLRGLKKWYYRAYRNPLVLFGFGAVFHFAVKHRFPWDIPKTWKREWRGIWMTNLGIVGVLAAMHFAIGLGSFFAIYIPVLFMTTSVGVWLFYVQHQFEEGYFHWHEEWDYFDAAVHGSTHLVLPKPLQWITGNIGLHHVHHLSARIPNYKLQECLDNSPELQVATQIGIWDGMKSLFLSLWDEEDNKLVSFREARRLKKEREGKQAA